MRWSWKWRKELDSGFYFHLLEKGFVAEQDQEPNIEGFQFYYDAFRELSTSRPVAMNVGAIPFTAIVEYFKIYELEDFDEFLHIIRQLDSVFLDLNSNNSKSEGKTGGGHNKKNTNKS